MNRRAHGRGRALPAAVVSSAAAVALLASSLSARAQAARPALLPTGPVSHPTSPIRSDDFTVPPTPAAPAFGPDFGPGVEQVVPVPHNASPPPFTAPVPPAVPLPPLAPIAPATPPPPERPAPFVLPERTDRPPAVGGLRQALSEYDRRAGLGPDGAVLSELHARIEQGYVSGTALLEVLVDRQKRVRSVRVLDSTGDAAAWFELANDFRGTSLPRLRLPSEANGAWMEVRVEALPRMPSGRRAGRVAWYPGTVIAFDSADWWAVEQRTVHARVVSEVWY